MRTQLLAKLDLDQDRLRQDLERSTSLHFSEPYGEYLCGKPWKSAMLRAPGGEVGDDVIAHYDSQQPSAVTPLGEQLPYVSELIEKHFVAENVTFARLAVMTDCALVPHRDYVEFDDPAEQGRIAHRLHVCLANTLDCMFMEDDTVYRMNPGEVWFLDVTKLHSAAVLTEIPRVHLILDFADADRDGLLNFEVTSSAGFPESSLCQRPTLSDGERNGLRSLASIIDKDNVMDVFAVVLKKHYRRDGGKGFVWSTMREIARLSDNPDIETRISELYRHTVLERAE